MLEWYKVTNVEEIDSPALLVYPERVEKNIDLAIRMVGNPDKLRPHVKTHKMAEVCRIMIHKGITRFKCATIAEAEMLADEGAPDALLAYQPIGPKLSRLFRLVKKYPDTIFSCLVDNKQTAHFINESCRANGLVMDLFIDLNVGMHRTGILPERATDLTHYLLGLNNLRLRGIHSYDGHIHTESPTQRQAQADMCYEATEKVYRGIQPLYSYPLVIVMGGTPTFPMHLNRANCEFSPGTFVFWDEGYRTLFSDLSFDIAALVLTRVVSIPDQNHICIDLGYKAIASESSLPRVYFMNMPEGVAVSHSEEHMVLKVPDTSFYPVGTVLYGIPHHICPTVALYEKAYIIRNNRFTETWKVTARDRCITI